jgi:hypothetical protein
MAAQPERPAWLAIGREDSSAVAMRSVAAALRGEFVEVWNVRPWQQGALRLIALAGKRVSIAVIEHFVAASSVDPVWAQRITTSDLASWAVSLYGELEGPRDALIVGAPNGGVAHLATAMDAPFLSQHFVTSYRDPTPVDDVATYQAHGAALAGQILSRNPDLAVINHYDPLHDRFLVGRVNHIRYKLLDLPEAYRTFIRQTLRPGGALIFTDCRYSWPMYFIGERHWFQVGGLGAVEPPAFIQGRHPEIAALQAAAGAAPVGNWGLKAHTAFEMPESEWGALPPLRDRVARFADENGYRFLALEGGHPETFSYLAFRVWRRLLKRAEIEPQGIFVETFTQVAPAAARRTALLPLWLPWNCEDSLDFLRRALRDLKQTPLLKDKPILWMPLPNFVETFDMAPWSGWLEALSGIAPAYRVAGSNVHPLGMRPHLYPADPTALIW